MKVIQEKKNYTILHFEKGEKFPEVFLKWLEERDIKGAFFYGLGGATKVRCGYYNLGTKEYVFKEFSDDHLEIPHIVGNVSLYEGKLKIHCHLVFADENFEVHGGHLDSLEVGGTLELKVDIVELLLREQDDEVGLPLLK